MTNIPDLIKRLESAESPSRELDAEIAKIAGIQSRSRRTEFGGSKGREWLEDSHGGLETWVRHPPAYSSSVDSALTLGRNDAERYAILEAIYYNWNDLYPLKRAILFGCAHALKARLS